jgi:hypothetical protein
MYLKLSLPSLLAYFFYPLVYFYTFHLSSDYLFINYFSTITLLFYLYLGLTTLIWLIRPQNNLSRITAIMPIIIFPVYTFIISLFDFALNGWR